MREKRRYKGTISYQEPYRSLIGRYLDKPEKFDYTHAYSENQAYRNLKRRYPNNEILRVILDL